MSLRSEIFEQSATLATLLNNQREIVEIIANEIQKIKPKYIFLAARGTSDNAGRYANYLLGSINQLPVALAAPSLFTYYHTPPRLDGALVIGISQSGQSPDIVSVLEEGRRQGCPTLAITNTPQSPLNQVADWSIDIQTGVEIAVAATKTYTGELMAIAMLSVALKGNPETWKTLAKVPEWVAEVLSKDVEIGRISERYRYMQHCAVLGRGFNYSTAFEWSLKLKELTYVVAEPYSSADFQHGPVAMVESGFPVMAVAPDGMVYQDMLEMLKRLRNVHKAEILVISNQAEILHLAQSPISIPSEIPEWLTPLVAVIPAQLFAYHLTQVKGYSTESPRSIQKVTETH